MWHINITKIIQWLLSNWKEGINAVIRRIQIINDTKIQYLAVADKIYKVTDIDFRNLTIETSETNLNISDVPEDEVFPIGEFEEFKIRLCNGDGTGVIVDIEEWVESHRKGD